jgi:lipoprotein-anchoring transpeptidase ErfK/SrfK
VGRASSLAVAALAVLAACAPGGGEPPPPGELLFPTLVTFDGVPADGATRPIDPRLGGVIVGHVTGSSITAHLGPGRASPVVAELDNPTDVGGPLVFQLVDDGPVSSGPDDWVEVFLPVRPNGTTGWVRAGELELSRNPYRIEIDVGRHRLEVLRGGQRWLETTVAIGTGSTPTPRGEFYIIELLQPPDPGGLYGPFAFGLSGFSETLRSFAGGDGVIGIHGTDEPEALGTDVSHGCVRVHNDVITQLAGVIPLGTPVVITD